MALSEKEKRLRAQTLYEIGQHLFLEGELEEAMNYFQKSLQLHPSIESHIGLAEVYEQMGMLDEAIEECRKAIDIDETHHLPYSRIAQIHYELHDFEVAEEWARRGLNLAQWKAPLYHILGRIHEKQGRWVEALQSYENAHRADKNFFIALIASMRLRARFN